MIKFATAKRRLISASAVMAIVAFALSPIAHADTFPYLKVFGADTWAGGAFATAGLGCSSSYRDPANNGGNVNTGGILTYANGAGGGSSDEFGALSLGSIDKGGTNGGFYSNKSDTSLSFANTTGADGGLLGANTGEHCIPDYYGKLNSGAKVWTLDNYSTTGQFTAASNSTLAVGGPQTVAAGTDLTLFVKGDVYIRNNITYASGYTEANVPKFALVVKGNIFIDPAVTQLDGVYIAQPSSGTTDGVIWTCYDTSPSVPNSTAGKWIHDNCGQKLTVNGSLIAEQVNFTRILPASNVTAGSPGSGETSGANNAAEVINYTPSMVIGGPFFNPNPSSSSLPINNLISLPPLY
jgi:hypothetical protein